MVGGLTVQVARNAQVEKALDRLRALHTAE